MKAFTSPLMNKQRHSQGATATASATVTVRKAAPAAVPEATDLFRDAADWTAADLRAYVVRKVEEFHGPQPDHSHTPKLHAIFTRFHGKYGAEAGPIAVWLFETKPDPGRWKGSPIKVGRFSKSCDTYMADEVQARLRGAS